MSEIRDQEGFRSLTPGERVELGCIDMSPGTQDGYRYRAEWVRRVQSGRAAISRTVQQ